MTRDDNEQAETEQAVEEARARGECYWCGRHLETCKCDLC